MIHVYASRGEALAAIARAGGDPEHYVIYQSDGSWYVQRRLRPNGLPESSQELLPPFAPVGTGVSDSGERPVSAWPATAPGKGRSGA